MLGVRLELTNKVLDAQGQPEDNGPVYFSTEYLGMGTFPDGNGGSSNQAVFQVKANLHGRSANNRKDQKAHLAEMMGQVVSFRASHDGLEDFFNSLATVTGSTDVPQRAAGAIPIYDSNNIQLKDGNGQPIAMSYTVWLLADLENNVRLFEFDFSSPAPANGLAQKLSFKLTTTDCGGIVSVVSCLLV